MKLMDKDALKAYLREWMQRLKESGECGGCAAELMGQVLRVVDRFDEVWCDPEYELPADSGRIVLAVVDAKGEHIVFEHAYQLATYSEGEGWILESWPEVENVRVLAWMDMPDWGDV